MNLETLKSDHPDLVTELIAQGQQQERQRIASIIDHEQATNRFALAKHLAFHTPLPTDQAISILGESPKEIAETQMTDTGFEKVMARIENPTVQAAHDSNEEESIDSIAQRIASH